MNDKAKPELRVIPDAEKALLKALGTCTFLPGSYDKRFVRDMTGGTLISERQLLYLYKVAHKYRRQMGAGNISDFWRLIADGKYKRWDELTPQAGGEARP